MVRNKKTFNKPAFTMIELIFAIVIIAISVMSLPMITQVTSKAMESNLAQEGIFAASAELNQVLSHKWDQNSQETVGELTKVIHTGSSSDCNISGGVQRPGHIHRMCLNDSSTISPTISSPGDEGLGGSQVSGVPIFETLSIGDGSMGYKNTYNMDIVVDWSSFGGSTNHNMKITLKAFTMIELVFVIVVMGIIGKFGVEFLFQAYNSFIHTKINSELHANSTSAVEFISSRLQHRIKDSVIAREDDGDYFGLSGYSADNATVLEWVSADT